ncbi:MAG: PTS sugar transporter subunit IIB [Cetobacterium sp.]|uniref:PTS system IIB component, L-Asc family n=1 Tax=Cetobacterium ceti TaxID=180163 RepID=A0A1T4K7C1_9FUSO|nr:PTS sugar transporter subunit IIB [Cetobacterium ceti]MCJ8343697.1 PTS sugar transporter subunit IIB [Cetobacterium sp.]SJZ38213.1 PTS system IIB component, L-Asc family [Cetobacterium ceti]
MKIVAVCGSGLGSSFMLEMNIKKVLKELGVTAEVEHTDLGSATEGSADLFVMATDIANSCSLKNKIALSSIINMKELKEKLEEEFKNRGIL